MSIGKFILGSYQSPPSSDHLRYKLYKVVFESDTKAGRKFDIALLISILVSVAVVMVDSIPYIHWVYREWFYLAEWFFTLLFTIEYLLRLWVIDKKKGYILSLYGIIDLLAILPTYISLGIGGAQYLMIVRALRLLRIFRIFKMTQYLTEGAVIIHALRRSYRKVSVFLLFILTLVTTVGSLMYVIEGPEHGFSSIPESIYWAIVTLTTVGYGDISPQTPLGKILACLIMLCGYAIIAVPTGIVTTEMARMKHVDGSTRVCKACNQVIEDVDANFCAACGNKL